LPRKPRFFLPDAPVHVVQRGHSREPVFFEDNDYSAYLHWVEEAVERYDCVIHAYALMTNHVHFLITPRDKRGISLMMQHVGRRYTPYINHTYGTSGSIWEGRFKASLIHDEEYLLTCMRYIELNPVRANMVSNPAQYRWSSYRCNAQGKENKLLSAHPLYEQLGRSKLEQCEAYKTLFKAHLEPEDLKDIRASLQTGTPLGNDYFKEKIEKKLKTKVGQARRGRPDGPLKGI
jgi:putative transposase